MTDLVTSIATSIQYMENVCRDPAVACKNNNPGSLMNPATHQPQVYPDYQSGWDALVNQVQLNINRGLTLNEFFAGKAGVYPGYAPAADNNQPYAYAAFVAQQAGIDPNVVLSQIGGSSSQPAGGGPIVDLFGSDATTPTATILDQLNLAAAGVGIDLTSPLTDALLAAGLAAAVYLVTRR